jgi:hypothetical protein
VIHLNNLFQPENSKLCGQTCIAMISNTTIEEAIVVVGHKKGTTTKELARAIRHYGYVCPERLMPIRNKELPYFCLCKIVRKNKKTGGWHWILLKDGLFYDPSRGVFEGKEELDNVYVNWELTSYLPITKKTNGEL